MRPSVCIYQTQCCCDCSLYRHGAHSVDAALVAKSPRVPSAETISNWMSKMSNYKLLLWYCFGVQYLQLIHYQCQANPDVWLIGEFESAISVLIGCLLCQAKRLYDDLINGYNSMVRPVVSGLSAGANGILTRCTLRYRETIPTG